MELDRVKTPVAVRDIKHFHVRGIIGQPALEAEEFF